MNNDSVSSSYMRRCRRRRGVEARVQVIRCQRLSFSRWLGLLTAALLFSSTLLAPSSNGSRRSSLGVVPVAYAADTPLSQRNKRRQLKETEDQRLRGGGGGESSQQQQLVQQQKDRPAVSLNQLLIKAGKRGLGGGISGFLAGVAQVLTLMWLRTIVNYQCRYGASFRDAFVILNREGGIARFYRGLWFALIQAPLARFVSAASNDGVEALLAGLQWTKSWGPGRVTVIASLVVGCGRIALMPIDTCKTVLQIDGTEGFRNLMRRVKAGKIGVLYQGSLAMAVSAVMANYPWFCTYNILSKSDFVNNLITSALLRNAGIGIVSSFVSDTLVNSIRVIKTTKQAMGSKHSVGYLETVRMILAADGWKGLFGRGLRARIYVNALQSLIFTIIWRGLTEHLKRKSEGTRDLSETTSDK